MGCDRGPKNYKKENAQWGSGGGERKGIVIGLRKKRKSIALVS
jgi:hypothetical protein